MPRNLAFGTVCMMLLLAASRGADAQGPAAAELRPLGRYVGSWSYEGEDKTPGTGGRVTCTASRRWISGGYFVESHRTCATPRGTFDQVEVFGFDFSTKEYTYLGFNGRAVSSYRAASLEGDSVTWIGRDASIGNRCIEIFSTDRRSSTDKCETAVGDYFILQSEGRYNKVDE